MSVRDGVLVLSDGEVFEGELIGAVNDAPVTGEVVFNTVMSGYQEVISDPSYAGQIITFTTSHLGNYGTNATDDESERPRCRGVVIREMARRRSNWRATEDLDGYLVRHNIVGIAGVDTRRLTRHLRDHGAVPGAIGTDRDATAIAARDAHTTDGIDLVTTVTTAQPIHHETDRHLAQGDSPRRVVAIDCGIKTTIVRHLSGLASVEVVPASTSAEDILARSPHGVFLSNGPGDPAAVDYIVDTVRSLLGRVPIFGICMGHQLLGQAVGATTFKLPFGHHGGNHPVRDLESGKVEITSQNHNYCVDLDGVADVEVTHVNLNDGTLEGFRCTNVAAFGIQYHPEAGPGPHDSAYLFGRFAQLMDEHSSTTATAAGAR